MIIAILEFAIGLFISVWSIVMYFNCYSTKEVGLADYVYYKETMYQYFFVGIIIFLSGISYIFNKKVNWLLTHSFIIFFFLSLCVWVLLDINYHFITFQDLLFPIILMVIFILLEIFQIKNLKKRKYSDNKKIIIISSIIGILFIAIEFLLIFYT